jgi:PRTRC genetic system protein C
MEVHRLEREFLYNRVKLLDTAPTMTPEQVRDTSTNLYPEIATGAIEGLKRTGITGVQVYSCDRGERVRHRKAARRRRRQHLNVN